MLFRQDNLISPRSFATGVLMLFSALSLHFVFAQEKLQASIPSQLNVTSVSLSASPANHVGRCPVDIKFTGEISANGKGTVNYTFVRSDGTTSSVRSVNFDGPGTRDVQTTWSMGSSNTQARYSGWIVIKILTPTPKQSRRAEFRIDCR